MTQKHPDPPHHIQHYRWIVEFAFRFRNAEQYRAVEKLGIMAHEVVRLYCEVVCPGSVVVEPTGNPIRHIMCRNREQARKLTRTFGGKVISVLPSDILPSVNPG